MLSAALLALASRPDDSQARTRSTMVSRLNKSARAKRAVDSPMGCETQSSSIPRVVLRAFVFDADHPNAAMRQPRQICSKTPQDHRFNTTLTAPDLNFHFYSTATFFGCI
jgi:hypothetical protein